ncbi:unnamed protein product [Owenia fusiformis]|uniref:Mitochondrial cardiolipin hydrolase n=1 Tax=Owenia fusiformis TaxID=6347 RepID=A0A8J1U5A1_OWEFU|nr:unnamed protein product [Owenia fusiformis]
MYKLLTTAVTTVAFGKLMYDIISTIYNRLHQKDDKEPVDKVIFFPDDTVSCRKYRNGICKDVNCRMSHDNTSFSQLITIFEQAKRSIDVCVFVITCQELANVLAEKQKRGLTVRIITDSEQEDCSGSQLYKFRAAGVRVRTDRTTFFMHHKFAIVDNSLLVNGSFNWTKQAVTGNFENLLITSNKGIIQQYQQEFNRLWEKFDPGKNLKNL